MFRRVAIINFGKTKFQRPCRGVIFVHAVLVFRESASKRMYRQESRRDSRAETHESRLTKSGHGGDTRREIKRRISIMCVCLITLSWARPF